MAGLVWQGRAHCGLDDAKNTARLLALLMHKGFKLSITNSLMCQTTDHSLMWKQSPELTTDHSLMWKQSPELTTDHSLMWKQSPELPSFSPRQPQKLKDMHAPVFHHHPYCFCGVKSSRGMVRKPGPKQGSVFFGCGNWTAARGALCHYFEWVSP
jgi:ERI1 exoribonuclease 2